MEIPEIKPDVLNPSEFLIAEYNYIGQAAFQANEDRARVASFYFVSVGSLVAAILGAQFSSGKMSELVYAAFSLLFAILTVLGVLTVFQLARLRAAWYSAARAMSAIKEYYLTSFPELDTPLLWRKLPSRETWYSIANLLRVQVSLLSALIFGAALYTLFRSFRPQLPLVVWIVTLVLPLGLYVFQRAVYFHLLRK